VLEVQREEKHRYSKGVKQKHSGDGPVRKNPKRGNQEKGKISERKGKTSSPSCSEKDEKKKPPPDICTMTPVEDKKGMRNRFGEKGAALSLLGGGSLCSAAPAQEAKKSQRNQAEDVCTLRA